MEFCDENEYTTASQNVGVNLTNTAENERSKTWRTVHDHMYIMFENQWGKTKQYNVEMYT